MIGTLINGSSIIAGASIGWLIKKTSLAKKDMNFSKIIGISILLLSIMGIISSGLKIVNNKFVSIDTIVIILSLIIGSTIGEIFNPEDKISDVTIKLSKNNSSFYTMGIINSTVVFCVGALEILGPLNSILCNDNSLLITKSLLDFPFAVALGMCFGSSVLFSVVPVMALQFIIGFFAENLQTFITSEVLAEISTISYTVFLCVGINMVFEKEHKIKTVNMLPSTIIPLVISIIKFYI